MRENMRKPYTDYRDSVPFVDLSGFIVKQPTVADEMPIKSLKSYLFKKKFSSMINMRRMEYCVRVERYRNAGN